MGKSKVVVVSGETGRAGIEIVLLPARSVARCARPTGGEMPNDKVVWRGTLIAAGVVIWGERTNAATLDSTPLRVSLVKAGSKTTRCTICTEWSPGCKSAGRAT